MYFSQIAFNQGFSERGSQYRDGSLKQGHSPQKLYIGCFIDMTSKSCLMQDLEHILSKYKDILNQIWSRGVVGATPGRYRLFYLIKY